MTKMTVHFDDGTQQVLTSELTSSRQMYQVKHDYELGDLWRVDPEVFRLNPQHYVEMTQDVQEFMFWLLSAEMTKVGANLEQKKAAWRFLYDGARAFTNGKGVDKFRDYITPANLSAAENPGLSTLICGGNVIIGEQVMAKWDKVIEPCLQVDTLDPFYLPINLSRDEYPYWVFYATISTFGELPNGTYKVTRFSAPKMMGANAPIPLMSKQPVVIPLWMLKPINIGSPVPSPYNY